MRSYQNFKATNPVKVSMMKCVDNFVGGITYPEMTRVVINIYHERVSTSPVSHSRPSLFYIFDTDVCLLCINTLHFEDQETFNLCRR